MILDNLSSSLSLFVQQFGSLCRESGLPSALSSLLSQQDSENCLLVQRPLRVLYKSTCVMASDWLGCLVPH